MCAEHRGAKSEKRSDGGKRDGNTAGRDTPRNRKQGEAKGLLKKGKRGGKRSGLSQSHDRNNSKQRCSAGESQVSST